MHCQAGATTQGSRGIPRNLGKGSGARNVDSGLQVQLEKDRGGRLQHNTRVDGDKSR